MFKNLLTVKKLLVGKTSNEQIEQILENYYMLGFRQNQHLSAYIQILDGALVPDELRAVFEVKHSDFYISIHAF